MPRAAKARDGRPEPERDGGEHRRLAGLGAPGKPARRRRSQGGSWAVRGEGRVFRHEPDAQKTIGEISAAAQALHPEDDAAAAWLQPLQEKLLASQAVAIITELDEVIQQLRGSRRAAVRAERNDLENNREWLDYRGVQERGEPAGSGAMESACKQYQCRFHRSGQFWTQTGEEALMCLETFWRNGRWSRLFPHVPADFDPAKI